MEDQSQVQTMSPIKDGKDSKTNNTSQIEVGLSKLQSTSNMLEKNESGDIALKALNDNDNSLHERHDKGDKSLKSKKKSREINDLEESRIIPTRLRSESGRVYSSGLVVDSNNITTILEKIPEEITDFSNMPVRKQQPCSENECCKNTAKIVNMIAELQQSVQEIKTSADQQVLTSAGNAGSIRKLEDAVQENMTEIKALDNEMTDYKFQLRLLTNIVIRQDQQIAMLTRKINDAQQREMYPNLVITGILEQPNEKPIQVYNRFVQEQLEIQELIPLHRAYRIGSGLNRPLIVELRDPVTYKPKIDKNAGKLKSKSNAKGGRYFIADHLPEEYNENRRRISDLISENKKRQTAEQFKMSAKRGRLLIDEQPYEKIIHPPTPRELMKPDPDLYKVADEIDMVRGKDNTTHGSKFITYAAAVHDTRDVQAAYLKVRMKFADATHVVCAYRLTGVHTPTLQDYVDDGEFGAGRIILNVLKEERLMNIVIFMIRYHGGRNLGPMRFDIFRETTLNAIHKLRKRAEEHKLQQQKQAAQQEEQHQQYMQEQRENPAFPPDQEGWHTGEEDWTLVTKKAN